MKSEYKGVFLQLMESKAPQNIIDPSISLLGFPFKVGK